MPNHCNNTLGITGPKKDIEEFIQLVMNMNYSITYYQCQKNWLELHHHQKKGM